MEENKASKRIVSHAEYMRLVGRREALRWGGVALAIVIAVLVVCVTGFVIAALMAEAAVWTAACLVIAIVCLMAAWKVKQVAEQTMEQALKQLNVVSIAHVKAADLPAPICLVRASSEPEQAQQSVLLRAAAEGQEQPVEQLMRASVGGEE